jgi:hypothetical protein
MQQEAVYMKKESIAAVLAATALTLGTGMAGVVSAPAEINTSLSGNRSWSTVFTNAVPLAWDWATNAATARLEITGMNSSLVTNFTGTTTNWLWRAFASTAPAAEDVYDLKLTFYTSGSAVAGELTSRLAVVTGAFGKAAIDSQPESKTWGKLSGNVVIPYDANWTNATADAATGRLVIEKPDGVTQTNELADASGYFGWKVKRSAWGYGIFDLTLTFPGTTTNQWGATLVRLTDGTMIRVQ